MSLAIVIVAHPGRRETTFRRCLESVRQERPDEIVVVADFPVDAKGVRSLVVPSLTRTTVDALAKRDAGWLATQATHVGFLCDDHVLAPGFVEAWKREYEARPEEILVPSRFCWRSGVGNSPMIQEWLPTGQDLDYAGGHAGIYARVCAYAQPWSATIHHPNWDVLHTLALKDQGCRIAYAGHDLAVEDIEGGKPWEMTPEQQSAHRLWHMELAAGRLR